MDVKFLLAFAGKGTAPRWYIWKSVLYSCLYRNGEAKRYNYSRWVSACLSGQIRARSCLCWARLGQGAAVAGCHLYWGAAARPVRGRGAGTARHGLGVLERAQTRPWVGGLRPARVSSLINEYGMKCREAGRAFLRVL